MKKPKDVPELASRLASAATTPLVTTEQSPTETQPKSRKGPKRSSVSVFLRLPAELYKHYDAEAVNRTKATGRGVTVQQVILDRLKEGTA